jgi:hypothetical protein
MTQVSDRSVGEIETVDVSVVCPFYNESAILENAETSTVSRTPL